MTVKEFNEILKANNIPEETVLMCHSDFDRGPVLVKGLFYREFDNTLIAYQENWHGYCGDVGYVGLNPDYFITTRLSKGQHNLCYEEIDYLRKNDKNRYHFLVEYTEDPIELEDCTFAEFFSYIKSQIIDASVSPCLPDDTITVLKKVYDAASSFEIV